MLKGSPDPSPESSRLSASLFRLLERSTDLIAVFDRGLGHAYCNDGVCRFMQMSREQILGLRYDQFPMSRGNALQMQDLIARVFATGQPQRVEVRGVNRDTQATTVFDISYHPELAPDGSVEFVVGVSRDVSGLRFAEEHARASAERLAVLLDSVDVAIVGVNHRLEIDFVNKRADRELRALAMGSPSGLLPEAPFDAASPIAGHDLERPLAGMPIAQLLSAVNAVDVLAHVVAVLASGEPVAIEHELLMPEAMGSPSGLRSEPRRFAIQVVPERDVAGTARGVVIVARDITRERQRETQLRLSERLAALGRIAAGVAHEIANPLSAVYGNLELARRGLRRMVDAHPKLAELGEMLDDAHEGAERIRQLIEEIGLLVRADTTNTGRVDLAMLIDKVVRMLGAPLAARARLTLRVDPVPEVAGSAPQLMQVLTNLLENALLAMPSERDPGDNLIELELRREDLEVVLRVSDNGVGVSTEALEQVFDPFFTTRAVGAGMGLGLTIAHGIATSHQGTLRLESVAERGATVTLRLPIPED